MGYEVTRDLPLQNIEIETPMTSMSAPKLVGRKMCIFSILRAGEGLAQGLLDLIPSARVGHVGLYRDPKNLQAVEYYFKAPPRIWTSVSVWWLTPCWPREILPLRHWIE